MQELVNDHFGIGHYTTYLCYPLKSRAVINMDSGGHGVGRHPGGVACLQSTQYSLIDADVGLDPTNNQRVDFLREMINCLPDPRVVETAKLHFVDGSDSVEFIFDFRQEIANPCYVLGGGEDRYVHDPRSLEKENAVFDNTVSGVDHRHQAILDVYD